MERGVLQGLAIFRWAAWLWTAGALVLQRGSVERPGLGAALVGGALLLTVVLTALWRTRPLALLGFAAVATELAVGAALIVCDGLVRQSGAVFETGQSLGSVFPLAGILTAGVAFGPAVGASTGVLGLGRLASAWLNDIGDFDVARVLSISYGVVFYALAGAVAGYIYVRLQRAENEVAAAQARENAPYTTAFSRHWLSSNDEQPTPTWPGSPASKNATYASTSSAGPRPRPTSQPRYAAPRRGSRTPSVDGSRSRSRRTSPRCRPARSAWSARPWARR